MDARQRNTEQARERESEVEVQNVARLELVGEVEGIKVDRWRVCDKRKEGKMATGSHAEGCKEDSDGDKK